MISENTYFSIVVPTYNRPFFLRLCLSAMARLNYPTNRFEIIVVDDGGKADLTPIIQNLKKRLNLRLIRQSNGGPASARNLGAEHANGDFLAFTDDDCAPTQDWLRCLASSLESNPKAAVCGKTLNSCVENIFSTTNQLISDYLIGRFNRNPKNASFAFGNNLAISRNLYHHMGGFNKDFTTGEDREFCYRLRKMSLQLIYEPQAVVLHAHDLTLKTLFQQHYAYGVGSCRYHRRCRNDDQLLLKLESPPFYFRLIKYPFKRLRKPQAALTMLIVVVSQFAILLGFLNELYFERRQKSSD